MAYRVHRNGDLRSHGATTVVSGQGNVFVNGRLVSVKNDKNTHGEGALTASNSDGSIFVNGKPIVLVGSDALPDKSGHANPKSVEGSNDVFASGGGSDGSLAADDSSADPTREDLYGPGDPSADANKKKQEEDDMPNELNTNANDGIEKGYEVSRQLETDGFNKAQAAGIVGNLMVESDQFRADTEYGNPNAGRGWAQWTGSRRRNFENYAARNGLDPTSDTANYNYLQYEMAGNDGNHWSRGYSLDGYKQVNDPVAASDYFMNGYERPGVKNTSARRSWATQVFNGS